MFWRGVQIAMTNLDMSFSWIILVIALTGSIIWFYADFKVGIVVNMLLFGSIFVWFYEAGLMWQLPLTIFILFFVFLVLSLYTVSKSEGIA